MRKLRRDRLHRPTATSVAVAVPLVSSRNLDLLSLALCSCALTLLCHSAATLPNGGVASNGNLASQSRPSNLGSSLQPFTMPSSRPTVQAEDTEEP